MTSLENIKKDRSRQGLQNARAMVDGCQAELDEAYATLFDEVFIAYEDAHIPQTEIADLAEVTRVRVTQIMQEERKRRAAEKRKAAREAKAKK